MIDKQLLAKTVEDAIEGTNLFLVDIAVKPGNNIIVEVDSVDGVDIDSCVAIPVRLSRCLIATLRTMNLKSVPQV